MVQIQVDQRSGKWSRIRLSWGAFMKVTSDEGKKRRRGSDGNKGECFSLLNFTLNLVSERILFTSERIKS